MGYREKPADRNVMTEGDEVFFMKTHKRRKAGPHPAIYLVRDGRDASVSYARLQASLDQTATDRDALFDRLLREIINRPFTVGQPSSGTWGGNVLSWLDDRAVPTVVLKFEDLIARPSESVQEAVAQLLPALTPVSNPRIPSFGDLQKSDAQFFRRGVMRSHKDEMSHELQDQFWAKSENAVAMKRLGYCD